MREKGENFMITTKISDGKITIDFSSTMFFEEIMKCPSDKRTEFIDHIKSNDSEWLFGFCADNFGSKIFHFEK
jgi:hypothetical protein